MSLAVNVLRPASHDILTCRQRVACEAALERLVDAVATDCHGAKPLRISAAPAIVSGEVLPDTIALRGLHLCATARLLALPGWRATTEGVMTVDGVRILWCSHDVEKGLRLLLRQSLEQLEWLAAPTLLQQDAAQGINDVWWDALNAIAPSAIHQGALKTYHAVARWHLSRGDKIAQRLLLTGLRLGLEGVLDVRPSSLQAWARRTGLSETPLNQQALRLSDLSQEGSVLSSSAPGYEELSQFLVRIRVANLT